MRRGYTVPELILVLAIVGLLAGIAVPRFARLADSLAVQRAAVDLVSAHNRARMGAVMRGRMLELTIGPDLLAIRYPGAPEHLWQALGPSAQGVALSGPAHPVTFSPVGITAGLSNGSYRLSRGAATRTVIVSRLGRVRVTQ